MLEILIQMRKKLQKQLILLESLLIRKKELVNIQLVNSYESKLWFSNSADDKIIEAAMVFWFMDDDWKYEDKVESMYQLLNT